MRFRKLRIGWWLLGGILTLLLIVAALHYRDSAQQSAALRDLPRMYVYHYENSDGTFDESEIPAKGRTFEMVQLNFKQFKLQYNRPNDELFLTDHRESEDDPKHPRWALPYKQPARRK